MCWSRRGADLLLQVRCAVYNGMLGTGCGQRFQSASASSYRSMTPNLATVPVTAPTTATTSTPRSRSAIPPRPWSCHRANAVPSEAAQIAPMQRDRHLRCIAERGRIGWQRAVGYGWPALVEADIARWKRVIGDGLRSQTDGRQASEVAIAANVLNQMLELGRPEYVRTA